MFPLEPTPPAARVEECRRRLSGPAATESSNPESTPSAAVALSPVAQPTAELAMEGVEPTAHQQAAGGHRDIMEPLGQLDRTASIRFTEMLRFLDDLTLTPPPPASLAVLHELASPGKSSPLPALDE